MTAEYKEGDLVVLSFSGMDPKGSSNDEEEEFDAEILQVLIRPASASSAKAGASAPTSTASSEAHRNADVASVVNKGQAVTRTRRGATSSATTSRPSVDDIKTEVSDSGPNPSSAASTADAAVSSPQEQRQEEQGRKSTLRRPLVMNTVLYRVRMISNGDEVIVPASTIVGMATVCSACGGGHDAEKMLLCDSKNCTNAYHIYCSADQLTKIPKGDWFCDICAGRTASVTAASSSSESDGDQDLEHEKIAKRAPSCSICGEAFLTDMPTATCDLCQEPFHEKCTQKDPSAAASWVCSHCRDPTSPQPAVKKKRGRPRSNPQEDSSSTAPARKRQRTEPRPRRVVPAGFFAEMGAAAFEREGNALNDPESRVAKFLAAKRQAEQGIQQTAPTVHSRPTINPLDIVFDKPRATNALASRPKADSRKAVADVAEARIRTSTVRLWKGAMFFDPGSIDPTGPVQQLQFVSTITVLCPAAFHTLFGRNHWDELQQLVFRVVHQRQATVQLQSAMAIIPATGPANLSPEQLAALPAENRSALEKEQKQRAGFASLVDMLRQGSRIVRAELSASWLWMGPVEAFPDLRNPYGNDLGALLVGFHTPKNIDDVEAPNAGMTSARHLLSQHLKLQHSRPTDAVGAVPPNGRPAAAPSPSQQVAPVVPQQQPAARAGFLAGLRLHLAGFPPDDARVANLATFLVERGGATMVPAHDPSGKLGLPHVVALAPNLLQRLIEIPALVRLKFNPKVSFMQGISWLERCAQAKSRVRANDNEMLFPLGTGAVIVALDMLSKNGGVLDDLLALLKRHASALRKSGHPTSRWVVKIHSNTMTAVEDASASNPEAERSNDAICRLLSLDADETKDEPSAVLLIEEKEEAKTGSEEIPSELLRCAIKMSFFHNASVRHVVLLTADPKQLALATQTNGVVIAHKSVADLEAWLARVDVPPASNAPSSGGLNSSGGFSQQQPQVQPPQQPSSTGSSMDLPTST